MKKLKKIKDTLTEEQKKELEQIALEIEAEAIQMRLDYEATGSEHSGSMVFINQESPLLVDESVELGTTMMVNTTQRIKKALEQQGEKDDEDGPGIVTLTVPIGLIAEKKFEDNDNWSNMGNILKFWKNIFQFWV